MFIYTREAHPGENVGHHDSFERKLACAKLLAEEAGIGRDILVDDLDGTVHRAGDLQTRLRIGLGIQAGGAVEPGPRARARVTAGRRAGAGPGLL